MKRSLIAVLVAILALALAIRVPFVHDPGSTDDMGLFASWLQIAMTATPGDLYSKAPGLNYPPGSAAIFCLAAAFVRHFGGTFANMETVREVVKWPSILADLACALLAFDIVRRLANALTGTAAAALVAFNPASIYISAFWGQFDAIPIAFALAALQQLLFGSAIAAWPLLALGILVKPQVALLVPIFALAALGPKGAPLDKRRLSLHGAGILVALVLTEAFALTFFPHRSPIGAAIGLLQKLRSGSALYPYTTLNAFNAWAIFMDFFASDKTPFLHLRLQFWGILVFLGFAGAIYARVAMLRTREAILQACALVMLALFLFFPEMHERYIYFALPLFALLIFRRGYAIGSAILALTAILNLEYAFTAINIQDANITVVNVNEFAPWLVHLCSIANVGLFFVLFAGFYGVRWGVVGTRLRGTVQRIA